MEHLKPNFEIMEESAVAVESMKKRLENSKRNKIYISGKISGIENYAIHLFGKAEKEIECMNFEIVNPMKLPDNHDKTWRSYMNVCIRALVECDTIYMLTNYQDSRGAQVELKLALALGINVIFQKEFK